MIHQGILSQKRRVVCVLTFHLLINRSFNRYRCVIIESDAPLSGNVTAVWISYRTVLAFTPRVITYPSVRKYRYQSYPDIHHKRPLYLGTELYPSVRICTEIFEYPLDTQTFLIFPDTVKKTRRRILHKVAILIGTREEVLS